MQPFPSRVKGKQDISRVMSKKVLVGAVVVVVEAAAAAVVVVAAAAASVVVVVVVVVVILEVVVELCDHNARKSNGNIVGLLMYSVIGSCGFVLNSYNCDNIIN